MKVLVVNAGSSSLKYQLMETSDGTVLAKGICERIGSAPGTENFEYKRGDAKYKREITLNNHTDAVELVLKTLTDPEIGAIKSLGEIEAVGHRIVHGGDHFSASCLYSPAVRAKLEEYSPLAPLHNPANLMGVDGTLAVLPGVPQVLVFDTAFHSTMPKAAYTYAFNKELAVKHHIRRYGFHGTSHRFVSEIMTGILAEEYGIKSGSKVITCHLGNGSSIAAVLDGKVIDTSMGFTPLAGIEMGTRCGDIDPAIVTFLLQNEPGLTPALLDNIMNKQSGLASISGVSSDCRDINAAINEGNKDAELAFLILAYQIKKYIGAYAAAMNGLDAIVFTAGVGENDPRVREWVCSGLDYLGVELDGEVNKKALRQADIIRLSSDWARVKIYLIPTNEELAIALDAEKIVGHS